MRRLLIPLLTVAIVLSTQHTAHAGRRGRADLTLRQPGTNSTTPTTTVGSQLTIEAFVNGNGEALTQATLFLSFDDRYLELVPLGTRQQGTETLITAFSAGGWLRGSQLFNDTLGDMIGEGGNQIPLFQVRYSEWIQKFQGAPQRVAVGNGVVARFSVNIIRKPPGGTTKIIANIVSPSGGETGYFINGEPGVIYNYRNITEMTVSVEGLKLSGAIPDLYILPGQIDNSLDLDDYIDDGANPDNTITWTATTADPDSIDISIDGTTHVVSVNPDISSTGAVTNFVGIAGVRFTASTGDGETVDDSIRVIVDTPPAFVDTAIADTVQFEEDTEDSSLVLVAEDPDAGAVLTYASLDTGGAVNTPAVIDSSGRVTFTPRPNYTGTETRQFTVTDQFGFSDTASVVVVVDPANDPPEFYLPFPDVEIGALGQQILNLPDYLRDVDDPYEELEITFTGVDSIAFETTVLNAQLQITAVTPFIGTRTATIVAKDTSDATGVTTINVTVLPPENPQPPQATVSSLKVGVKAGQDTSLLLDNYVQDIDTPKNRLVWRAGPIDLVSIGQTALTQRRLEVSAEADSVGFVRTSLTVTDPTALFDVLPVRVYSASPVTGIPVAGGLPDLTIPVGQADSLDLDDYYFDATNTDDDMLWSFTGNIDIGVELDRLTRKTVLRAPAETEGLSEEIVFTATDPEGNAVSDTMRITVLPEGAILVDLDLLVSGGVLTLPLGSADTLDLDASLRAGDPADVSWTATSRDPVASVELDADGSGLEVTGDRVGNTFVVITATSAESSSSDSFRVAVTSTSDGLQVVETFEMILQAERDTIVNLNTLVVSGNSPNLLWSSPGNPNVGVEVDPSTQLATLRPAQGFIGDAGSIEFQVRNPVTDEQALSTATPVTVEGGGTPTTRGLLRISVVANPVLPNFLDVFVISQRDLFGDPFLRSQVGEGAEVKPKNVQVDSVEEVTNVWVGDLVLSDAVTGRVELSATGITQTTRVALTDTMVLEIEEAGIQSTFAISNGQTTVRLPRGALAKPAIVALIPRTHTAGVDPHTRSSVQGLVPAGPQYLVHSTTVELEEEGTITYRSASGATTGDRTGIYRWNSGDRLWHYVGGGSTTDGVTGTFSAFGVYGLFADNVAPRIGEAVYEPDLGGLLIPVEEVGSGIDTRAVDTTVGGVRLEASYSEEAGGLLIKGWQGGLEGAVDVRIALADLAGNTAQLARRIDLAALMPRPGRLVLHQNYPNPFNPSTVVRFELPADAQVRLSIYNALGQEVRRLVDGSLQAGRHVTVWDATDEQGRTVGAGIYVYALRSGSSTLTRKMLLLK